MECSPDLARRAAVLRQEGCRFEAEILTTGEVSLTVERGDNTLAIEISPNGPAIDQALARLVETAARALTD